jgi:hypothetical protein
MRKASVFVSNEFDSWMTLDFTGEELLNKGKNLGKR